jgi:hypothetical protein
MSNGDSTVPEAAELRIRRRSGMSGQAMGHSFITVGAIAAAASLLAGSGDRADAAPDGSPPAVVRTTAAAEETDAAAIPPGAPDDDYGLVAWCEGALTGHMALFPLVKPELDRMEHTGDKAKDAELDAEQMAAGTEYLQLYARARHAADVRGDGAPPRAEGLIRAGQTLWAPVRAADASARMWSWVMWELPARCETAARRLEGGTSAPSDVLRRHSSDDPAPPAAQAATAAMDSPDRR